MNLLVDATKQKTANAELQPDRDLISDRCGALHIQIEEKRVALEQARNRFQTLVVNNPDAVVVLSNRNIVRFANVATEQLLAISRSQLLGRPLELPNFDGASTRLNIQRGNGQRIEIEARRRRVNWRGETCWAIVFRMIQPQQFSENALLEAAQAAEFASRMKSQFLANMSHELRTPLNSIIGFSEIIRNELFGPLSNEKYRGYMEDIHKSGRYLLRLINDLLDLSKAEAGQLELREDEFDIAVCFRHAVRTVTATANKRQLNLVSDIPEAPLNFIGDEAKIMQITLNLLSNAIKFTPSGGRVSLAVRIDQCGRLQLLVADEGIGIPPDKIRKVFQPFAQVHNTNGDQPDGTGLGLSLTKRLVALHDGAIKLSSAVGVGSEITVTFPQKRLRHSDISL